MDASRKPAAAPSSTRSIIERAEAAGHSALDEHSAKQVLRNLGIAVPSGLRLGPDADVASELSSLRPPFVLKALSDEAIHKSDIGAVRLGLTDSAAVQVACVDIRGRLAAAGKSFAGFLVEEMAASGVEIVIGGVKDPQLGPMIMVGAGGIFAEILKDVSFRLCPIDARDANEMLSELKLAPILNGTRGEAAVDLNGIRAALLALGGEGGLFLEHVDRISEFDLNPLIARHDGLVAVDCRIVLKGGAL